MCERHADRCVVDEGATRETPHVEDLLRLSRVPPHPPRLHYCTFSAAKDHSPLQVCRVWGGVNIALA